MITTVVFFTETHKCWKQTNIKFREPGGSGCPLRFAAEAGLANGPTIITYA